MIIDCPLPEVDARPAEEFELPRNAISLMAAAIQHGWETRATFARGTYTTRTTARTVDSIAVRMHRHPALLVGLWYDGAFECGLTPHERFGLRDLKARIEATP